MSLLRDTGLYSPTLSAEEIIEGSTCQDRSASPAPIAVSRLHEFDDDALVEAARDGDKRAFDLLAGRHQQLLLSILMRMLDLPDAQDVAQEALLKAYRSLHKFRGDSQFSTWLYRIAVNTALNRLKLRKRTPGMVHLDTLDNDQTGFWPALCDHNTPEAQVIAGELEALIEQQLDGLAAELHESLVDYELQGMSYQEIADHMRCPVGTVRSRISRGRGVIDDALRSNGYDTLRRRPG